MYFGKIPNLGNDLLQYASVRLLRILTKIICIQLVISMEHTLLKRELIAYLTMHSLNSALERMMLVSSLISKVLIYFISLDYFLLSVNSFKCFIIGDSVFEGRKEVE